MKKIAACPSLPSIFLYIIIATCSLLPVIVHAQNDPLPETFQFKLGITYQMASDDKKGQEMNMWFSEAGYSGMEVKAGGGMFMVYALKSMKMVTLIEAQKMMMVMDLNKLGQQIKGQTEKGDKTVPETKFTKTGNKAQILGYNCDEYKAVNEQTSTIFWITAELGEGFGEFGKSLMLALNGGRPNPDGARLPDMQGAANGAMLKMEITDLSNNKTTRLEATAVNKDGKTISTSGYKAMSVPGH